MQGYELGFFIAALFYAMNPYNGFLAWLRRFLHHCDPCAMLHVSIALNLLTLIASVLLRWDSLDLFEYICNQYFCVPSIFSSWGVAVITFKFIGENE